MALEPRRVAFEASLRALLDSPGLAGNRKKLARALGVNEATISHYLHGRIRPSFDTLVGISDFFNVSLDYLVFGERPRPQTPDDPVGVRAQIRRAIVESSDLGGRHLDMFTRISRRLEAKISDVARDLAEESEGWGPVGFVTDAEAIGLEACITRMRIMTRLFQSDTQGDEPGAFFEVVSTNLRSGRPYQYLLYGEREAWTAAVESFRELVVRSGVPVELSRELLQFRSLNRELISSVCILDLDVPLIKRQEPILWERHQDNISAEGVWAYLSIERPDAQGGVTIEPLYLDSTLRQFHRDWVSAKPM
ncbi:helix-turn-helix domain-containing protein [Streptomyces sp. NBC_01476]|uniref:helix-turn-helix domain-containing protein n=1 Tax=Streptomyces sp. NBC_01476 TaxID=2903881 RepID=UPI002E33135C|nr:helix-turn-helix transcriptional regulator [Streptomyces sp. NBC_01476]